MVGTARGPIEGREGLGVARRKKSKREGGEEEAEEVGVRETTTKRSGRRAVMARRFWKEGG